MDKQKKSIKWTPLKDNLLISEMFVEKPYEKRSGSNERGLSWENIARNLKENVDEESFNVYK